MTYHGIDHLGSMLVSSTRRFVLPWWLRPAFHIYCLMIYDTLHNHGLTETEIKIHGFCHLFRVT